MRKREVRRILRDWRKKGGEGERYRRSKQEYKKLCKKRREKNLLNGRRRQRR